MVLLVNVRGNVEGVKDSYIERLEKIFDAEIDKTIFISKEVTD